MVSLHHKDIEEQYPPAPNSGELGRHKVDLSRDQAFSWLEDKMDDLKGGIKNQLTQDIGMMQQQVCL